MSKFVADIRRAVEEGRVPEAFRAADLREACPDWSERTYSNFLPKHRVGNPVGYRPYFIRNSDGTYSLL